MGKSVQIKVEGQLDAKGFDQAQKKLDELSKGAEGNINKIKSGFKGAGDQVVEFGDKVNKALLVGVAGIGAGLAFSVKQFANFDEALTKSTAIMGDVSDVMRKEMSDAAREVAKTTAFSATEAAESYFFLASAGLDAAASIAALPQVAAFAQAGAFDMARATDLLTDAQSALGLASKDAAENLENMTRISDVLVKANTMANASVEQFSEALTNKAGAAMRMLGMEIEEGVAVLAVFADQGLKGSAAGIALNATLEGLTRTARNQPEAYAALGVSVFDASGEMRNMADIVADLEVALAGMSTEQQLAELASLGLTRQAMDGTKMLLGNSDALRTYEESLRSSTGFTEDVAAKQMETFNAQIGLLKDKFLDVALSIGEKLMPHIMAFADFVGDKVVPAVERLAEQGIAKVQQLFDEWGPKIQRVVTVLKDKLQPIVERVVDWMKNNTGVVKVFFGVLAGMAVIAGIAALAAKFALLFNPIGLIIAGIALLAAGIYWAYTRFEVFRNIVDAVGRAFKTAAKFIADNMDTIKTVVGFVVAAIVGYFKVWFKVVSVILTAAFQVFKKIFEGFMAVAKPVFRFITDNWDTISSVAQAVFTFIKDAFENAFGVIQTVMETTWQVITTAWTAIRDLVDPIIEGFGVLWDAAFFIIQSVMSSTKDAIMLAWEAIKAVIDPIITGIQFSWDAAMFAIGLAVDAVKLQITFAWQLISMVLLPIIDGIKIAFTTAWDAITVAVEFVRDLLVDSWNIIFETVSPIIETLGETFQLVWTAMGEAIETVREAFFSAWDAIYEKGKVVFANIGALTVSAMNGVIGAIESGINAVIVGLNGIINGYNAVAKVIPGAPQLPTLSNVSLPRVKMPRQDGGGAGGGGGGGGGAGGRQAFARSAVAGFADLGRIANEQLGRSGPAVVIENYNTFSKVDDQALLKLIEFEVAGGRL